MIEMKLVLATFFSKYRIISLNKPENVEVLNELTLKPRGQLSTIISKRNDVDKVSIDY